MLVHLQNLRFFVAEFFYEYGLFFLKALTIVFSFALILMVIVAAATRSRGPSGSSSEGQIEIKKYNERLEANFRLWVAAERRR